MLMLRGANGKLVSEIQMEFFLKLAEKLTFLVFYKER